MHPRSANMRYTPRSNRDKRDIQFQYQLCVITQLSHRLSSPKDIKNGKRIQNRISVGIKHAANAKRSTFQTFSIIGAQ